ncbi:MAG: DUF559 domain-containing protein [Haloechinothrix sp.]
MALRDGRLVAPWPRILVEQDKCADPKTLAASAVLSVGDGAVLVNQTAVYLYGCTAARPAPIHLNVPYDRWPSKRDGLVLHHGRVNPEDIIHIDGLPVQGLDLALADLLCNGPRRTALACTDQALAKFPEGRRDEMCENIALQLRMRSDRRGTLQAERLLSLATGLPESPAESSILLVVVDGGFPTPVAQHKILSLAGREVYRLDFAWVELRIALEYDGYEAHEDRATQDAARDEDLRRRGWIVVRACAKDLADSSKLLAELRLAFQRRLG